MEKKRSFGIIFLGNTILIGGVFSLILSLIQFPVNISIALFWLFLGIISLVVGRGLLDLKEWARIAEVILQCIGILYIVAVSISMIAKHGVDNLKSFFPLFVIVAIFTLVIYYLTRPKVKERFN